MVNRQLLSVVLSQKRVDEARPFQYNAHMSANAGGKSMIQTLNESRPSVLATPINIMEIARHYVTTQIGTAFTITKPRLLYQKNIWWALIQYQAAGTSHPIGVGELQINVQTGTVIPLNSDEVRLVHEKAAVLEAKQQGKLPVDARGIVLREFARKQASRYLWDHLGMYYGASDPIFAPGEPPFWQVTIVFKMYELGPFPLGSMAINAQTGEPIPLTENEITQIKERIHVIAGHQTSSAKPG
jgi:hypothetical protein